MFSPVSELCVHDGKIRDSSQGLRRASCLWLKRFVLPEVSLRLTRGASLLQSRNHKLPGGEAESLRQKQRAPVLREVWRPLTTRSSSREVRIRVPFFSVAYFGGNLPRKRVKGEYGGT